MNNQTVKVAGTVAALAAAIGVTGVVAYDRGKADGGGAEKRYELHVDRASLDVVSADAGVWRDKRADTRNRLDVYVGRRNVLQLVGSYKGTTGKLTITRR